jgi:hypothetical protein
MPMTLPYVSFGVVVIHTHFPAELHEHRRTALYVCILVSVSVKLRTFLNNKL